MKWDGDLSPAEKYARAFGKNVETIQDAVSAENGVPAGGGSYVVRAKNEKSGTVVSLTAQMIE